MAVVCLQATYSTALPVKSSAMLPIIENANLHPKRLAIVDASGPHEYYELLIASQAIAHTLLNGQENLEGARVAFMASPGFYYVATQWGIWRAGGVAVPICLTYPEPAIAYVLEDAQVSIILADDQHFSKIHTLAEQREVPVHRIESSIGGQLDGSLPFIEGTASAMILYTSGTTGKPKGVVSTHDNIKAQVTTLVKSWAWHQEDYILNVLPLHHVHGIINVTCCALWVGACVHYLPKFSPEAVFEVLMNGKANLFMAVPTIYHKLIAHYKDQTVQWQKLATASLKPFRLMVSGSAALPVSVLEQWNKISGHTLLERYGMTEIGMAISNPYEGERRPGYIGQPLPGVAVRLVDTQGTPIADGESGEIQVKGASVFHEYWQRVEATQNAFTSDGWFKTGDIAVYEQGSYRILGRNSVDIIKSGGYKISALEIEEVLRTHNNIQDCAVVGLPDEEWGEIVAAMIVATASDTINTPEMVISWLKERLPAYKVPRKILSEDSLPRNAMGKVVKNEVKQAFFNESTSTKHL